MGPARKKRSINAKFDPIIRALRGRPLEPPPSAIASRENMTSMHAKKAALVDYFGLQPSSFEQGTPGVRGRMKLGYQQQSLSRELSRPSLRRKNGVLPPRAQEILDKIFGSSSQQPESTPPVSQQPHQPLPFPSADDEFGQEPEIAPPLVTRAPYVSEPLPFYPPSHHAPYVAVPYDWYQQASRPQVPARAPVPVAPYRIPVRNLQVFGRQELERVPIEYGVYGRPQAYHAPRYPVYAHPGPRVVQRRPPHIEDEYYVAQDYEHAVYGNELELYEHEEALYEHPSAPVRLARAAQAAHLPKHLYTEPVARVLAAPPSAPCSCPDCPSHAPGEYSATEAEHLVDRHATVVTHEEERRIPLGEIEMEEEEPTAEEVEMVTIVEEDHLGGASTGRGKCQQVALPPPEIDATFAGHAALPTPQLSQTTRSSASQVPRIHVADPSFESTEGDDEPEPRSQVEVQRSEPRHRELQPVAGLLRLRGVSSPQRVQHTIPPPPTTHEQVLDDDADLDEVSSSVTGKTSSSVSGKASYSSSARLDSATSGEIGSDDGRAEPLGWPHTHHEGNEDLHSSRFDSSSSGASSTSPDNGSQYTFSEPSSSGSHAPKNHKQANRAPQRTPTDAMQRDSRAQAPRTGPSAPLKNRPHGTAPTAHNPQSRTSLRPSDPIAASQKQPSQAAPWANQSNHVVHNLEKLVKRTPSPVSSDDPLLLSPGPPKPAKHSQPTIKTHGRHMAGATEQRTQHAAQPADMRQSHVDKALPPLIPDEEDKAVTRPRSDELEEFEYEDEEPFEYDDEIIQTPRPVHTRPREMKRASEHAWAALAASLPSLSRQYDDPVERDTPAPPSPALAPVDSATEYSDGDDVESISVFSDAEADVENAAVRRWSRKPNLQPLFDPPPLSLVDDPIDGFDPTPPSPPPKQVKRVRWADQQPRFGNPGFDIWREGY